MTRSTPASGPDAENLTGEPASPTEPTANTPRRGPVRAGTRPRRRWIKPAAWSTAALFVALATPIVWVQAGGAGHEKSLASVTTTPVTIVLGAGLTPQGTPKPYLARRLDAALTLYNAGKTRVILVSGDNSGPLHNEPGAMRTWLMDNGVPADRIVMDDAGYDTHDSCTRARQVYGVTEAIVVTQDYHVPRATFLCQRAGVKAQGVGVSARTYDRWKERYFRARELPASLKAAFDGVTHRVPSGGIAPSNAVRDALATADSAGDTNAKADNAKADADAASYPGQR